MRQLLAATILLHHNYRILHWNVKSTDFDPVHELMDGYVSQFNEWVDQVAEMGAMVDEKPVAIHELESVMSGCPYEVRSLDTDILYSPAEVFLISGRMLETYNKMIEDALKEDSLPRGIQSELETMQYWVLKELKYKNKQRLA